ncbi:VOC family protein [Streptomyces sp. CA-253872]|uniref:VOC family protein n=1 Tax=Streptomyces sp. CA-253872 TaxID=3240067 RepID=UPI003D8C52B4
MKARDGGMWWGTAVEAPDPGALGRFYAGLLDWHVGHEEPGTTIVAASPSGPFLVFQYAEDHVRPVWPPVPGGQRPMMHFDFQVGDLEAAVAEAVERGAVPVPDPLHPHVRTLLDPAGHPFCLCYDGE